MGRKEDDHDKAHTDKFKSEGEGINFNNRHCTDVLCCVIFVAFIGAMIAVAGYSLQNGNPLILLTPYDSSGNQCGKTNQAGGDFTDYKYKYFSGLTKSLTGAGAKTAGMYDAVCVKECPKKLGLTACKTNNNVRSCPTTIGDTTLLYTFCVPSLDSAETVLTTLYQGNQQFAQYVADIRESAKPLMIMAAVTFVISMLYIYLLKWFAKPLLYISIVAILVSGVIGGFYLFQLKDKYVSTTSDTQNNNYKYCMVGAIVTWAITGLYLLCILCQYSHIALGAGILAASSEYLSSNNRIVLLPIVTYILTIPVMAAWAVTSTYLMTIGTPEYKEGSFICTVKYDQHIGYVFWANLFGFFWIIAFVIAVQQFTIGATACMWYFRQGSDDASTSGGVSITQGVCWCVRYHMGSIAFGAFLIAVLNTIKALFEYFVYQYEQAVGAKDNVVFKIVTCCIRCVIWCVDSYIKFMNKNAYIQIALQSTAFCPSAQQAFYLMLRHAGRFSIGSFISFIMAMIGKGIITSVCVVLTYFTVGKMSPQVAQPWIPAIIIGMFAWLVASLFLSIYEFGTLAILHCFILNEDLGGKVNTPESLVAFLDETKRYDENVEVKVKENDKKENQVQPLDAQPAIKGNDMS